MYKTVEITWSTKVFCVIVFGFVGFSCFLGSSFALIQFPLVNSRQIAATSTISIIIPTLQFASPNSSNNALLHYFTALSSSSLWLLS